MSSVSKPKRAEIEKLIGIRHGPVFGEPSTPQQHALAKIGFDPTWFLPLDLADQWQTPFYPRQPTNQSFNLWHQLIECEAASLMSYPREKIVELLAEKKAPAYMLKGAPDTLSGFMDPAFLMTLMDDPRKLRTPEDPPKLSLAKLEVPTEDLMSSSLENMGRQLLRALQNDVGLLQCYRAQEGWTAGSETQFYVTLDQAAAVVNRSKRTLGKAISRKQNPLPDPEIQGTGGKPNEWLWDTIRPWLEQEYNRSLPLIFPNNGRVAPRR